ncbi:hypothetical protein D9M71_545100 [compost metagenome]
MAQGDRQLGLGLTLEGALQQVVAFFVIAEFVRCTGSAEVVKQRLTLGFGSPMQVTLRAGPATLGQVQLTVLDRHLHSTAAVTP